ncbi:MAG: hypothetical protein GQ570_02095 [Helicobacteraceae bacterium]|nr:hypothetical protein [Helicobacteraceae bacterium]
MKLLLSILLLFSLSFSDDIYEADVTAEEAYEMQKKGEAIIVDVRTPIEFIYIGHGEGFINIPSFEWSYIPKKLSTRIKSAQFEIKNSKVKDHKSIMKLYKEKEKMNKKFIPEVMEAMKANNVTKVILVCRSGPRSKASANMLASNGIEAYNLEDGYIFGWKETELPQGGE